MRELGLLSGVLGPESVVQHEWSQRGISINAQMPPMSNGECSAEINAPTENLIFDLILHRVMAWEVEATPLVLQGGTAEPGRAENAPRIPCAQRLRRLETVPPRVSTSLFPRYSELLDRVYRRPGWTPEDFRALRFEMKCPPLHSLVLLLYDLPERP